MVTALFLSLIFARPLVISGVRVEGTKTLSKTEIKSILRIKRGDKYYPPLYNNNKLNLIRELRERGYFEAKIIEERVEEKDDKVYITLRISEGKRYRISAQYISWLAPDTAYYQRTISILHLPLPRYYASSELTERETKAIDFLRNIGYLNAEIQRITAEDSINKTCTVTHAITKGTRYVVKQMSIKGNSTVRRKIIEREITVKPGQYVSPAAILESIRRIYSTGLFTTVYHSYEFTDDSLISITFNVKERKTRYFRLQGGIYPFSLINLNAEGGHRNLFDNNQNLSIRIENGLEPFDRFIKLYGEVLYSEPYFFNTSLKMNLKLFGGTSKIDSSSYFGIESYLSHYWSQKSRTIMGLQWRKFLEGHFSDGITNKAIFGSIIDTRDNLLFPSRGFYLLVDLSRAGGILGGNYHFYKYQLSGSFYRQIWKPGGIFALRLSAGQIIPFNNSDIPAIEKFKIGGDGTLRGFRYSQFYSTDFFLFNTELRSMVSRKVGLNLLFDVFPQIEGKVWYSFGLGFRYFLPIGNLRVDWMYTPYRIGDKGYYGNLYINLGEMF